MSIPLADYKDERDAFGLLLNSECKRRILMFRGESGSGKTTLLANCLNRAAESIAYISVDLKSGAVNVAEIFSRCVNRLSAERMPNFVEVMAQLQEVPPVKIDRNWLTGIANRISVTLHVENQMDQQQRRVDLTNALFADLKALEMPVLFIFDTYEKASTEVQDWISSPFLTHVAQVENVRVLIGGKSVPKETIEWMHCCNTRSLNGVPEPEHWLPVVQAMNLQVPVDDTLSWLVGICDLLKGRPNAIMQYLETYRGGSK